MFVCIGPQLKNARVVDEESTHNVILLVRWPQVTWFEDCGTTCEGAEPNGCGLLIHRLAHG